MNKKTMRKITHRYMFLSILLGILSIGISITLKISAQTIDSTYTVPTTTTTTLPSTSTTYTLPTTTTTTTTTLPSTSTTYTLPTTTTTTTAVPCSYTYSSWSACSTSGRQTRTIASRTPSGCYDAATPILEQSCTYIPPVTTTTTTTNTYTCTYNLSDWSTCSSAGIQTRTILSRTPYGCYDSNMPTLQRTCTYSVTSTPTTTNTTSTISGGSSSGTCYYSYSRWSECSSSGNQTRVVIGKTPLGCTESTAPRLEQSCTYTATTTNSSILCAYITSDWSLCDSTGKQTRVITSRTPYGCTDSSLPELSRVCTNAQLAANTTTTTTSTNSSVTPEFNFLNLNGGEAISGTIKIEGTVASAYSVELYLVPVDSNIPKYLGLARHNTNNVWEYSFNSEAQPNGSYYIRTKVKNAYGTYEAGQRMMVVLNPVADSGSSAGAGADFVSGETSVAIDQTNDEWQNKYFKSESCVDQNICGGMADPDKDGINNNDEYRYGTSPTNPDSDGDGYLDGDEVKSGFNPLKAAPGDKSDKIVFESPKESGEVKKDLYAVNTVEVVKNDNGEDGLKITGKGIPNSFVTVYVYSDPIVFTIKTDNDGNWSYVLDKNLEDGEHEVYVAVTDNTGAITGKSEVLGFVKTAQAVTIVPPAEASAAERAASPTSVWYKKDAFFFVALAMAGLALALAAIGLIKHHQASKKIELAS